MLSKLFMLMSQGTGPERSFLEKAFSSARTFANLGVANTVQGQSIDGNQVFEWLYGTEGLDGNDGIRSQVRGRSPSNSNLRFLRLNRPNFTYYDDLGQIT